MDTLSTINDNQHYYREYGGKIMKKFKVFAMFLIIALLCSMAMVLVACDLTKKNQTPSHTHIWSQEYTKGEDTHWYSCSGCDDKKDESKHSFKTGICVCGKYVEGTEGLNYTLTSDEDGYKVNIGDATNEDIVIASYHDGKPVTDIANQGFANCTTIKSIVIPESVDIINYGAFYQCENLTSVIIPDSVTTIGQYAFRDCKSLQKINLPDSVIDLADYSFYNCTSLTEVVLSNNLEDIKTGTFGNCSSLKKIKFGDNLTGIGTYAFRNCTSLYNITLPANLQTIGANAFINNGGLTSVVMGSKIDSIGKGAFDTCYALTIYSESTGLPDGWHSDWNISNCPVVWNCKENDIANDGCIYVVSDNVRYALTDNTATVAMQSTTLSGKVVIADNVTYNDITYKVTDFYLLSAFSGNINIESVEIGANITTINAETFYKCSQLKQVKFGNNITQIESWAFAKCSALTDIFFVGSEQEWNTLIANSATDWNEDCGNINIHFVEE